MDITERTFIKRKDIQIYGRIQINLGNIMSVRVLKLTKKIFCAPEIVLGLRYLPCLQLICFNPLKIYSPTPALPEVILECRAQPRVIQQTNKQIKKGEN